MKKYQNAIFVEDEEELDTEKTIYNDRFEKWKHEYYHDKLKFTSDKEEKVTDLAKDYVEDLQWVCIITIEAVHLGHGIIHTTTRQEFQI